MSAQPSVDWETAGVWAGQLTPAGPTPSRTEATDLVADLRQAAHRARDLALEASGLADALAAPGAIREPAQVLVVDRAGSRIAPGAASASARPEASRARSRARCAAWRRSATSSVASVRDGVGPAGVSCPAHTPAVSQSTDGCALIRQR